MQLSLIPVGLFLSLMPFHGGALTPDEATTAAESALELAPEDPELLIAAADAWLAADDKDRAAWYATLAREANGTDSPDAAVERGVVRIHTAVGMPQTSLIPAIDEHSKRLFNLAEACRKRKLYANAAELLGRLRGTRYERQAMEKLSSIFQKDSVVQELLAAGIEVPPREDSDADPVKMARQNAKHRTWKKAWEVKSKNYTVRTNMDYDMAVQISQAMEQINVYYRVVFGYKKSGGGMQRCLVEVHRTRDGFDLAEDTGDRPTLGGFYSPTENRVVTFDGTSIGMSIDDLWETLFHEASHQFTRQVWKQEIPTWLNEGTASYFEGARILPGGAVVANGIPDSRLSSLRVIQHRGSPSLRDVINYFEAGSYPGEYYPVGWGLVYFFHNYEDAAGERPYLEMFRKYREEYQGSGVHDVEARFIEFFVTKAKVDGVTTLDEFDKLFQSWIKDLNTTHFGGREKARVLFERARKQRDQGHLENAADTYRWALEKRDDHAGVLLELADVLVELKRDDAAVFRYRQLLELARGAKSPTTKLFGIQDKNAGELAIHALEQLRDVERGVADLIAVLGDGLSDAATTSTSAWLEAGFPRVALVHLDEARAILNHPRPLVELSESTAKDTGADIWRWRTLPVDSNLDRWSADDGFSAKKGELVASVGDEMHRAICIDRPADAYHYEAHVSVEKEGRNAMLALVLGAGGRERYVSFSPISKTVVMRDADEDDQSKDAVQALPMPRSTDWSHFVIGVAVRDRKAEIFVDGKSIGAFEITARAMRGRLGVVAQDVDVVYRRLRVRDGS
tara:strand:- start:13224 stop:15611 length:2388 start_codon:yes stop_codon:yes gene_type:complete